jgi:hypothetical protein
MNKEIWLLIFIALVAFYSVTAVAVVKPPPPEVMPQPEIVQAPQGNSQTGSYLMTCDGYLVEGPLIRFTVMNLL